MSVGLSHNSQPLAYPSLKIYHLAKELANEMLDVIAQYAGQQGN